MHESSSDFLFNKGLLKATNLVLGFFLLLGTGIFIWASNKGFDFTDEGLYLLVYQHPHEFPDSYTSYHRVGAVFFDLVGGEYYCIAVARFFLNVFKSHEIDK
jgi:hypothetical protein